jgi:hypothetical protein
MLANHFGRDMLDEGFASVQLVNFELVEVETGDVLAYVSKPKRQRQPDIAATDYADLDVVTREKFGLAVGVHPAPRFGKFVHPLETTFAGALLDGIHYVVIWQLVATLCIRNIIPHISRVEPIR